MIRIAALNESFSSESSQSGYHVREATKEAKEAEAFDLYAKALELLRHGELSEAEDAFNDLIDHEFLIEAYDLLEEKGKEAIHPGLQLLYSIHKNLAAMAIKRKDHSTALDCYLEAVKIDDSEVTVWYKIGVTALALEDFQMAMISFEHGLDCNPKHWPCLDNVITVLYALSNYVECLYYISKAFELEVHYNKGYAFRDKIFSEQPSLERDYAEFLKNCDPEIKTICIDPEEAQEYINEAIEMRRRHSIVCKPPDPELLSFPDRIKHYSWHHVGEILTTLYDKAASDNTYSIALKVKVPDYKNLPESNDTETVAMETMEVEETTEKTSENEPDKQPDDVQNSGTDKEQTKTTEEPMECGEADKGEEKTSGPNKNEGLGTNERTVETIGNEEVGMNELPMEVSDDVSDNNGKEQDLDNERKKDDDNVASDVANKTESVLDREKSNLVNTDANIKNSDVENKVEGDKDREEVGKHEVDETSERMETEEVIEQTDAKVESGLKDSNQLESEVGVDESKGEISDEVKPDILSASDEDSSSSICEAMSVAHALLDSLSPGKSRENYVIPNSPRRSKSTTSPKSDSSVALQKEAKNDTNKSTSSQSEGITKTNSYGFTVTELFAEDLLSSQEDETERKISLVRTSEVPLSVLPSINSDTPVPSTSSVNVSASTLTTVCSSSLCRLDLPTTLSSSSSLDRPYLPISLTASSSTDLTSSPSTTLSGATTSSLSSSSSTNLASAPSITSGTTASSASSSGYALVSSPSSVNGKQSGVEVLSSSVPSIPVSSPSFVGPTSSGNLATTLTSLPSTLTSSSSASVASKLPPFVSNADDTSSTSPFTMATSASTLVVSESSSITSANSLATVTCTPSSMDDHGYSRSYTEMPAQPSTPKKLTVPTSVMSKTTPGGSILLEDNVSSASYIEIPIDIDDRSPSARKSQKRKRPSLATEDVINYGKRRSARVRNTGGKKKEEETVNFSDLLHTFLPSTIKNIQDDENMSANDVIDNEISEQKNGTDVSTAPPEKSEAVTMVTEEWNEIEMVKSYLDSCINNKGLLNMCCTYLHILARHYLVKWPEGLCEMYMSIFNRIRKHLYIPRLYDNNDPPHLVQKLAQIFLVQVELQLDKWLVSRSKLTGTVITSPRSYTSNVLSKDDIPPFYKDDIIYLTTLCSQRDRLETIWINHCFRVYWMKARFALLRNKIEEALYHFDMIKEYIEFGEKELNVNSAYIPNCIIDNFINMENVTLQYELLQQTKSVEETERLYEKRDYKKVVEVLLQNFITDKQKAVKQVTDIQERQSQIVMLLEALFKTEDFEKCLYWCEETFNECYTMYKQSCKSDIRSSWIRTMINVFTFLHGVVEKDISIMKGLGSTKTLRLSTNLIKVIDVNMSLPESIVEMAIDSVLPWILLYHIIKQEEVRLEQAKISDDTNNELEENISSSQMLLNIAHDSLGSRCWCTKSDGALLIFYMSLLKIEMSKEPVSKLLEEYQQSFEQCVYCLYGHPNRKGKAKHLQDHNVTNVTLKWEQAIDVFDYFKPKILPEFDGYKSETISTEMENLFKRITPLIPESSKNMGVAEDVVRSYIEGTSNITPVIQDGRSVILPVVDEIYYLLGDYYLKNKEHGKAIKFYIQDVCMNPGHLDAWAGMALARMSQLDSKLASADLKMNTPIYKKSIPAMRCFKRAVEIDDSNSKLWIEYGTLAYQLHSHSSRQLKWLKKKWFEMDEDFVKTARECKQEMLSTATECFKMAADCDWSEDAWLHNYMLGKCSEKSGKDVKISLEYYYKALEYLHTEKAKYPKRIVYAYTTPHLAVEALEMYYRIHITVLKLLLNHGAQSNCHDYKSYIKYIINASHSPFVKRMEKGQSCRTDRDPASSADESSCMEPDNKKSKSPSSDHTYFRNTGGKKTPDGDKDKPMDVEPNITDFSSPMKAVTTLELHSEDQDHAEVDVVMATVDETKTLEMLNKPSSMIPNVSANFSGVTPKVGNMADAKQEVKRSSFSIANLIGKDEDLQIHETGAGDCVKSSEIADLNVKPNSDNVTENLVKSSAIETKTEPDINQDIGDNVKPKSGETDKDDLRDDVEGLKVGDSVESVKFVGNKEQTDADYDVKSVLTHIEDLIEAEMGENSSTSAEKTDVKEDMDVNVDDVDKDTTNLRNDDVVTSVVTGNTKIDDEINELLKLSAEDLHKILMEKCRQALVLCLQRFPTHYKSHYWLAYLYLHSPYHKDTNKVHNILLGTPKWQQLDYMPCQGLFGERKQTKFFQGIWKIPIDEIDRSGSFPSHLNRSIELALHILKLEKDSQTLHQVHLQLNRQPEAGKKYLRDAEKKYYALISHEYTLDSVEMKINDMKMILDPEERSQFLLVVYKIYEHGVHKLNKYVERTNNLLAEAYRVVLRKYETLPMKMLLAEAVRYCKHQLSQKQKTKVDNKSPSAPSTPTPVSSWSMVSSSSPNILTISKPSLSTIKLDTVTKTMMKSTNVQNDPKSLPNAGNEMEVDSTPYGKSSDVIVLSDNSMDDPAFKSADGVKKMDGNNVLSSPVIPSTSTNTPTVKIKMGLLQAVKRLKPNPAPIESLASSKASSLIDLDSSQEENMSSAVSEYESEAPFPSGYDDDDAPTSRKSGSSSSSSSSSDDSSDDNSDDDSSGDDGDNDDDDESDDNDESPNREVKAVELKDENKGNNAVKQTVKKVMPTTEDEDESSENDDEIDLISSDDDDDDDDNDDDKDKDYNASEEDDDEDDVIMISDDEFGPKGKAIIPSPPHSSLPQGTEILVKDVPDFNTSLISSMMLSEADSVSTNATNNPPS